MEFFKITKIDAASKKRLLKKLVKYDLVSCYEIMRRHRVLIHAVKDKYGDIQIEVLSFCALVLAINSFFTDEVNFNKQNFDEMSLAEIREISIREMKIFKHEKRRKSPKKEQLLERWSIIKNAKNNNMSFREISDFLDAKYSFKISHSMIYQTWKEIEHEAN